LYLKSADGNAVPGRLKSLGDYLKGGYASQRFNGGKNSFCIRKKESFLSLHRTVAGKYIG
jgi:hypothetical protein